MQHHALILAAGKSSRMGKTIKQLAPIPANHSAVDKAETPLLEHCVNEVQKVADWSSITIVLGSNHEKITEKLSFDEKVKVVINPDFQDGIGTSIACGVKSIPFLASDPTSEEKPSLNVMTLMLADQPEINALFLNEFIKARTQSTANDIFMSVSKDNHYFGPPVSFPESCFSQLMTLTGDQGARKVVKSSNLTVQYFEHPSFTGRDLDTIEQLNNWKLLKKKFQ